MMFSVDKEEVTPFRCTQANESQPMFSPNGRWIAYATFRDGRSHVFVERFPVSERVWKVSTDAGEEPVWSPNGKELYYRNGREWWAVTIATEPELDLGEPRFLFEGDYLNVPGRSYDITPDGKHFILLRGEEAPAPTQVHVVQNWFDELRRLAPSSGD